MAHTAPTTATTKSMPPPLAPAVKATLDGALRPPSSSAVGDGVLKWTSELGCKVGDADGWPGTTVGCGVGERVGERVGDSVGERVGEDDGNSVRPPLTTKRLAMFVPMVPDLCKNVRVGD